jgi:hypothetical protein
MVFFDAEMVVYLGLYKGLALYFDYFRNTVDGF